MKFEELLKIMEQEGETDDTAHEILVEKALDALYSTMEAELTDEQQNQAVEAYIRGFCKAEGYGTIECDNCNKINKANAIECEDCHRRLA